MDQGALNVPPGHRPAFCLQMRGTTYAYYENCGRYLCFIMDGGKQYSLYLGSLGKDGSMLGRAARAVRDGEWRAALKRAVGKPIAGNTRTVAACMGAIEQLAKNNTHRSEPQAFSEIGL